MNEGLAVRDVMTRDFVGVSESDTVRSAAELLLAEDAAAAVVLRGSEPVGLWTERDALAAIADGVDARDTPVSEVMHPEVPTVEPGATLGPVVDRMSTGGTRWFVVRANGDTEGLLSVTDVVSAATLASHVEDEPQAQPERHDQSICERCGSLTRDLLERDGALVCPSCRSG